MIQAQRSPFRVKVSDFNPVPSSKHSDPAPSLTSRPEGREALKTWKLTPGEWRRTKTSRLNLSPYPFKKPPSAVEEYAQSLVKANAKAIQKTGQWATDFDSGLGIMELGYVVGTSAGKKIPVTAVRCDPGNVSGYAQLIAKTSGLVIAINADATEIPDTYLSYAHKKTADLGFKGQAAVLRKKGGKSLPNTFKKTIKRFIVKTLPPSGVIAIPLDDNDRGQLQCKGLLAINGPSLTKGQRTEESHVDELGKAFENMLFQANKAGARKVTYTGISTGRFNFDPLSGGEIAMECMINALVEGKLDQAVGAFWCGGKDNKILAGSTAQGALASLICSDRFQPGPIPPSTPGSDTDTESSSEDSVDKRRILGVQDPWASFHA